MVFDPQPSTTRRPAVTTLRAAAVTDLRRRVRGQVLQPDDTAYDDARAVYNAMHARWPALVLRAGHADDVVAAVDFAREHGLQLAVRGGGHSIAGFGSCDDGLVLDHSRMSRVDVDSGRRIARAEAGCTWADFNDATHAFGLATTGGLISTTGIAGLTLGGGIGYLSRPCGLSCDNLVSADVVLANGERLTCSETTNSDLLWALRGGGGNFGVVTAFEFRIHPVNAVVAGPIFFPLSTEVVRAYREFMLGAPEQLGAVLGLTLAPPVPCLPPDRHGTPVAVVIICWPGEADDADAILRPLTQAAPALGRNIGRMPYPAVNTLFDSLLPPGLRHYWKSLFVHELTDAAIDAHVEHAVRAPNIESGTFFYPMDGACHRVAAQDTAFPHRRARFAIGIHGSWRDARDDARCIEWVRACHESARPHGAEGEYVGFMSDGGRGGIATLYGPNYPRLVAIKRHYDPNNFFCLNQNIDPEA